MFQYTAPLFGRATPQWHLTVRGVGARALEFELLNSKIVHCIDARGWRVRTWMSPRGWQKLRKTEQCTRTYKTHKNTKHHGHMEGKSWNTYAIAYDMLNNIRSLQNN